MVHKILVFGYLLLAGMSSAFAQAGYIVSDTAYTQGHLIDQSRFRNNREARFRTGKSEAYTTFGPGDIREYGFAKGLVYVRRFIPEGNGNVAYFLFRSVDGERKLYELSNGKTNRFFVERDSLLLEVMLGQPLGSQLKGILNPCSSFDQVTAQATSSRSSLRQLIILNNRCFNGFFPRIRYGALAGVSSNRITIQSNFEHYSFVSRTAAPYAGAFVSFPVGTSAHWFLDVQGYYQRLSYGGHSNSGNQGDDYLFNISTFGFPVMLKYTSSAPKWRPYVNAGVLPMFYGQQQNVSILSTSSGSVVNVKNTIWDPVKKFQMSGTVGAGVEYSINRKHEASLELRYTKLIDAGTGNSSALSCVAAFYF